MPRTVNYDSVLCHQSMFRKFAVTLCFVLNVKKVRGQRGGRWRVVGASPVSYLCTNKYYLVLIAVSNVGGTSVQKRQNKQLLFN